MSSTIPAVPQPTKGVPRRLRNQLQKAAARNPFRRMGGTVSTTGSTNVARARARCSVKLDEVLAGDSVHSTRHEPQPGTMLKNPSETNRSSGSPPITINQPKCLRDAPSQHGRRSLQIKSSLHGSKMSVVSQSESSFQSSFQSNISDWEDLDCSMTSFCDDYDDTVVNQRRSHDACLPRESTHRTLQRRSHDECLPRESTHRTLQRRSHDESPPREPTHRTLQSRPYDESTPREPTHRTLEEVQAEVQLGHDDEGSYEMELSPGYYVPFRGGKEVWKAVDAGNALECFCLDCGIELVSVPDCEHVICPDCRMVNPVFGYPAGITNPFGAGIGLKKEWVTSKKQNQRQHS
jgi:hypothetical protein